MSHQFKVTPIDENQSWQKVVESIKKGFELQSKDDSVPLNDDDIVNYNDAIIIAPDYQREYRSTIADESSLIESALLDIPIPPIFLASNKYRGVQVLNVVDGQHRLRAFYRYLNGDFGLTDLSILKDLDGLSIGNLPMEQRIELLSRRVSTIIFRNFPGKDFELEIFNRYNKGTKPLTQQEIRHAVFDSSVNTMITDFCSELFENPSSPLSVAYAISKDRYQKKTCHENMFVILSIIEKGVIQSFTNDKGSNIQVMKSPQFVESFMKEKSEEELQGDNKGSFDCSKRLFDTFNYFVSSLTRITNQPFSKEIYGVSSKRGNKYQVSVSMALAGIFKKLNDSGFDFSTLEEDANLNEIAKKISNALLNSHLEDPEYKASTTNPNEIQKIIEDF